MIFSKDYPNGFKLKESYLNDHLTSGEIDVTLKEDQYFVMGDNRDNSEDSRFFGPISRSQIIGVARLRLFPLSAIQIIRRPRY